MRCQKNVLVYCDNDILESRLGIVLVECLIKENVPLIVQMEGLEFWSMSIQDVAVDF